MTTEKLIFETSIDGLYRRSLAGRLTPALIAELQTLGLDVTRPLPPALSRDVWYASVEATARHLYPSQGRADGLRELGRDMLRGIEETLWGKAFAPAVRLLGPRRLLKRVPANMKTTSNFSTGVLTELSPTSVRLEVDDNGTAPELFQGSLERILLWAGARAVDVTFEAPNPPAATFLIRWTE
jgi:uncharacterized protein (TIGR02265 family)